MAQIADIRYSPPLKRIDPDRPIRISITAKLPAFSLVYRGEFATTPPPKEPTRYVENPAALELGRQIYTGLFGKDISIDELRHQLRLAHFTSGHTLGDPIPDPNPSWTCYELAFDHLVPAEDDNPEVLTLVAKPKQDNSIRVGDISSEHYRASLNAIVKQMGGALGETSADGLTTFWP